MLSVTDTYDVQGLHGEAAARGLVLRHGILAARLLQQHGAGPGARAHGGPGREPWAQHGERHLRVVDGDRQHPGLLLGVHRQVAHLVPVPSDQGVLRGVRQSQGRLPGVGGVPGPVHGGDHDLRQRGAAGPGGGEAGRGGGAVGPVRRVQGHEEPAPRNAAGVHRHRPHLALLVPLHPLRHRLDGPRDVPRQARREPHRGGQLPGGRPPGRLRPAPQLHRPRRQLLPHRAHVPQAHRQGGVGHEQLPRLCRHGHGHRPQLLGARRHRWQRAGCRRGR